MSPVVKVFGRAATVLRCPLLGLNRPKLAAPKGRLLTPEDMLLVISMSGFLLFSDHGPRASTEATITPEGHESQTELEQCPSELIGNFCWDGQGSILGEACLSGKEIK
jgi:hypothetical protein